MQAVPTGLRTHSQKVCSYYKRALRNLESWYTEFPHYRIMALRLRREMDKNANIKDLRVAKHLLTEAEKFLLRITHPQPKQFPTSPGGVAFERHIDPPDWVLDAWEPMEKAAYPKYFALREKRKKEYIEFFNKMYPNAPKEFEEHKDH